MTQIVVPFDRKVTVTLPQGRFQVRQITNEAEAAVIGAGRKAGLLELFEHIILPESGCWSSFEDALQTVEILRRYEVWEDLMWQAGLTNMPTYYKWVCYVRKYATFQRFPIGIVYGDCTAIDWLIAREFIPQHHRSAG